MTLYIVKHADGDYRLRRENGDQIGSTVDERPSLRDCVDILAEDHSGASILGDPVARLEYTDIVTGAVNYRDLTIEDETVPWQ